MSLWTHRLPVPLFFFHANAFLYILSHTQKFVYSVFCLWAGCKVEQWEGGGNSCPSFFAAGTIGCCAVSFLHLSQPSLLGERGLILCGCVWFLWGSIDPVATYLRGRAPRCLFWRREGNPCEVALTIHILHQISLRSRLEQAKWVKRCVCVCIMCNGGIKWLHLSILCMDVCACVCPH